MKIRNFALLMSMLLIPSLVFSADPYATVDGQAISEDEVNTKVKKRLFKLNSQIYDIKRDGLESLIDDIILKKQAKKESTSVKALLKKEVFDKIKQPTEAETKTMYEVLKRRFKGKSYDEVKGSIKGKILSQSRDSAMQTYLSSLRKQASIKINYQRPRVEVAASGPGKGNPDAPIKIVEFSEYQCPFCKRARPTLDKVLKTYGDKIYYVFRDFPLSFHKQAQKAAEAAHCANDQSPKDTDDKYWAYSDMLWENQGKHSLDQLKTIAEGLKLNMDKFNQCLSSNKYAKLIKDNQRAGSKVGVTGTPAYFINGKFISGAQPFEKFKALIDEDL